MFRTVLCLSMPLAVLIVFASSGRLAAVEPAEPNIYQAPADLTVAQLVDFIQSMQEKPISVRRRPGFQEAIVEAADRLLESAESGSKPQTIGILARFRALHALDEQGDRESAELLQEFAAGLQPDKRPAVAREAAFHLLRARVAAAADLKDEERTQLLADLQKFMEAEPLEGRHLLLASATVGIINGLEDDQAASEAYRTFGAIFAKSADRELAAYGRKIAKGPPKKDAAQPVVKPPSEEPSDAE